MKISRRLINLLAIVAMVWFFTGIPNTSPTLEAQGGAWIEIVAPSYTSGDDFATVEVGNPWDMDSVNDIDRLWTTDPNTDPSLPPVYTTYYVENGILKISTNDTGYGTDFSHGVPHRPLAFNLGGKTIDTQKYRYFSYRFQLSHDPQSQKRYAYGNVNRVRWYSNQVWSEGRTSDILVPPLDRWDDPNGWYTYTIDLWTYPHVTKWAPYKGTVQWNILQLMFHEANYGWPAQLDWAMLTANNTASDSYTVKWNMHGFSSGTYTTTIYWSTAPTQTAILPQTEQIVPPPQPATPPPYANVIYLPAVFRQYNTNSLQNAEYSYAVNTDYLTSGQSYYIAIKITDGVNPPVWAYSSVPVTITQ